MFRWVLNTSPITASEYVSEYVCFYYYYFHFEWIKFRSSRLQMSFKTGVFRNFAIFTGHHLDWSLFIIKLPACKPANCYKESMNIANFLRTAFLIEHFRLLLVKDVWNLSGLHHEEQKRLLLSWSGFFIHNLDHVHNQVRCFY